MRNSSKQNQEFYDNWSKTYDTDENSTIHLDEANFYKFWSWRKSQNALEIGCGSGRNTQKLALFDHQISAIDLSSNMIEIAKTKVLGKHIEFIVGDFAAIELASDKYDFAIISLVLEHIEDIKSIFAKIFSHLKSGASLYISEIHPSRMLNGSGARYFDESQNEIRATSFCHTEEDFENAANFAGFQITQKSTFYANEEMAKLNPKWSKYCCKPMILVYEFYKP